MKIGAALLVAFVAIVLLWQFWKGDTAASKALLQTADRAYFAGEKAEGINERKEKFNTALQNYLQLEKTFHPREGNGRLDFNTANALFQLEQYPLSIYYYYRAKGLRPRDVRVQHNLEVALQKAKVATKPETSVFQQIFAWHFWLSQPERLQLFSILTFLLFALLSVQFWKPHPTVKSVLIFTAIAWACVMGSLLYSRFVEPIEGVLVRATSLYRDAGLQFAKVQENPILGGSKVEVLDTVKNGEWVWIKTPEGTLGYVPSEAIRVI